MAVRVQNEMNIRKAKRWNEKDDAALLELLRKKVKEVNLAIKESTSPFMRSKLKAKKAHYKSMANKVANGTYNGDIIFSEMQAAAALRTQDILKQNRYSDPREAKKYINSYEDMDFDYERYFRKTRYYGRLLPILMTVLTFVILAYFILGAFLPASIKHTLNSEYGIKPDVFFTFKLGPDDKDFRMSNEKGDWPDGDWVYSGGVEQKLTHGEPYVDPSTGEQPEYVYLYTDLGMRTINVSSFDIIKAWFRTKMLKSVRIDFLEDDDHFKGPSWFYVKYMDKAEADIVNLRDSDGGFNLPVLIKYLAGYGTILLLIVSFVLAIVALIINIARIFSYTTRRFHTLHILLMIFSLLILLLPALMAMEGTNVIDAFKNYFVFDYSDFLESESTMMISLFGFVPVVLSLLLLLLPKIFKNRLKKRPTFVPKGNRPRLEKEQKMKELAYDNVRRAYQNNTRR